MRKVTNLPSRAEQVYQIILENICDGTFEPGLHLVQEDLATQLGVSRQPVQQAMLLLKSEGLVIESGARGLYVAPLDPQRIVHHYQVRISLDRLAARLVAERIAAGSDALRQRFEESAHKLLAQGGLAQAQHDANRAVLLDMSFHSLIYTYSGNPLIGVAAEPHWNFLRRVMVSVLLHAGRGSTVWHEHESILERLLAGDAEGAEQQVATHILGAQSALLAALEAVREPEADVQA
ncbi:GntR family transcriptional regulator [Castellaniella sp.]|uniref:GntR family transcriptional regulator n=1 Tax=Castellaniella sp. TaxID=1955812 RepID=UPI002AFF931B|nr:GntR family transcriptional regulator [Castellaniella sp.]